MQHEVLVCLLGHPGDIVVDTGSSFEVAKDIPFLAPSDKTFINRIVKVGYDFACINRFVENVTSFENQRKGFGAMTQPTKEYQQGRQNVAGQAVNAQTLQERQSDSKQEHVKQVTYNKQKVVHGVYLRTLGSALGATLSGYRQTVVAEERSYMADKTRPLGQLLFSLRKYELLFPALRNAICEIEDNNITGAAICNCIYHASVSGFPDVKACFDRLLFSLHEVMYNQLLAWVLHGTLIDQYGEFFIAQTDLFISSDLNARDLLHGGSSIRVSPSSSSSSSFVTKAGGMGMYGNRSRVVTTRSNLRREFDWRSRYHINYAMLPEMYLPIDVAETILFIGKAVQVLKESAPEVVAADEEHIAAVITALRARPIFNLFILQKALDTIRQVVSSHLWNVVSNLIKSQNNFSCYLLLATWCFARIQS